MKRIAARAAVVAALCMVVSLGIASVVLPLLGAEMTATSLVMCVVCPLLIAVPFSVSVQLQRAALADAHDALMSAHGQLAAAHIELAVAHSKLSEKARRDDMTGMLKREAFFAALDEARNHSDGVLLIIDADHFKQVNDNHGHLAGDEALVKISAAISACAGDADILGRIGGEEFAAFLVDMDDHEAKAVAECIRRSVASISFVTPDGQRVPLSVSIGGARHVEGASVAALMRQADICLYEAKRSGRNRLVMRSKSHAAA